MCRRKQESIFEPLRFLFCPQINTVGVHGKPGKRRSKRKVKRNRDQNLLSMDDEDDDDDNVAAAAVVADVSAGGDDGETVDLFVAPKKQPQENQLLMLHDADDDNDDADEDDEEEVLLHNNAPVLHNGNTKSKHSAESSESVSGRSSRTSPQPPLVISHIAAATPTRRTATASSSTSPLKSSTRLPHEEADDICLVPEIDFEGMSTDAGSDNRESQPLLGGGGGGGSHSRISDLLGGLGRGHDHVDLVSNTFGGKFSYRTVAHAKLSKLYNISCRASQDSDVFVYVYVRVCVRVCITLRRRYICTCVDKLSYFSYLERLFQFCV